VGSPYKTFGNSLHEESGANREPRDKITSTELKRYKSQICGRIMKLGSNLNKDNNVFLKAKEDIHMLHIYCLVMV
jgi:hypothetical protein